MRHMPKQTPVQAEVREAPSFEGLLSGGPPKDANVIIVEEGAAGPTPAVAHKRLRSKAETSHDDVAPRITVPCHQLVLYSQSRFFQNKLDRWSDTDGKDSGRKQLQLLVPHWQQELGQRLVAAMYADQPQLSDLSVQQLVQLALLAESYDVGKVVAAAARSLGQLQPEQLTVEMVSAVLALPESCLQLTCFGPVRSMARNQLQRHFGDLEVVWGDTTKAEQLLQLPFAAILQLVDDQRTRVASEDTIVYTLGRWLEQHPDTSSKQKEQLAGTVRLPRCSATFLSSAKWMSWLLDAGYTQQELLTACVLPGYMQVGGEPGWVGTYQKQRAAWQQAGRQSSTRGSAQASWNVSLVDVRSLVEQEAPKGIRRLGMLRLPFIWHGREFKLWLTFDDGDKSIGFYMGCPGTHAAVSCTFKACLTDGTSSQHVVNDQLLKKGMQGWLRFVPVPESAKDWAAVEAILRRERLVHGDGCLHLQVTITHIR